jgi:uncharacterized protein (DUF2345 family)
VRERGAVRELRASSFASASTRVRLDQAVVEAPALRLLAVHGAAGEQQLAGAPLADDARQHRARAHVRARQADAREQERDLAARVPSRRSLAMAMIAPAPTQAPSIAATTGCGQPRASPTRSPVIRVNASSSSIRCSSRIFVQRADDLVHVAAGAEVAAGAGDHDHLDVGRKLQLAEGVAELRTTRSVSGFLRSGPTQRNGGDRSR